MTGALHPEPVEAFATLIARRNAREVRAALQSTTDGMLSEEAEPYRSAANARLRDLEDAEAAGAAAIMGGVA